MKTYGILTKANSDRITDRLKNDLYGFYIGEPTIGSRFMFFSAEDTDSPGVSTSEVKKVEQNSGQIIIHTLNSIYTILSKQ